MYNIELNNVVKKSVLMVTTSLLFACSSAPAVDPDAISADVVRAGGDYATYSVDINHDGIADLYAVNSMTNNAYIFYMNKKTGQYIYQERLKSPTAGGLYDVVSVNPGTSKYVAFTVTTDYTSENRRIKYYYGVPEPEEKKVKTLDKTTTTLNASQKDSHKADAKQASNKVATLSVTTTEVTADTSAADIKSGVTGKVATAGQSAVSNGADKTVKSADMAQNATDTTSDNTGKSVDVVQSPDKSDKKETVAKDDNDTSGAVTESVGEPDSDNADPSASISKGKIQLIQMAVFDDIAYDRGRYTRICVTNAAYKNNVMPFCYRDDSAKQPDDQLTNAYPFYTRAMISRFLVSHDILTSGEMR